MDEPIGRRVRERSHVATDAVRRCLPWSTIKLAHRSVHHKQNHISSVQLRRTARAFSTFIWLMTCWNSWARPLLGSADWVDVGVNGPSIASLTVCRPSSV